MIDPVKAELAASSTSVLDNFVLTDTDIGAGPADLHADTVWTQAPVPGGVHEALMAAGRIEHPYRDRNEDSIRWIEDRAWWYRTTFKGPDNLAASERVRLVFHGLDTVADIWLNGEFLGHHENMFRPAEFEVTDQLHDLNELLVRFSPPLYGLGKPAPAIALQEKFAEARGTAPDETEDEDSPGFGGMSSMHALSTLRRKATFSWGWDFGPRVPSIGVWRPVELVRERKAALRGHHIRTDAIEPDGAHLSVVVDVDLFASRAARARVTLTSPSGAADVVTLPVLSDTSHASLIVAEPELWWTHDMGTPSLYDVLIELLDEDDALLAERRDRIGIRTIALDRSPDIEGGRLFRFLLNGVPIFARGANWLPADMLVGSVDELRYRTLLGLARDANMNMLRVWGGGIYEHDAFYAISDELGLLLWHDFMFACTDYPDSDPVLRAEVTAEAEYQVSRLRNRPSLAMWCGNNEAHLFHGFAYQGYSAGTWGAEFYHRILPDVVSALDGGVPYWPGSPWGDDTSEGWMAVNGVMDGDRHAWEVWHGTDMGAGGGPYTDYGQAGHYRRYANDRGKFISEFGIHASPELATLERWIEPATLGIHSDSFDAHMKDRPKDKGDALLRISTGLPKTMTEYVDATMAAQAEGLKFGIEHYRRRQPHCSGTLVWQLNDVWPGFSWSVLDYDAMPKASYYALKRVYAPVLASFTESGSGLELWVTNSSPHDLTCTATVRITDRRGDERLSVTVDIDVRTGGSKRVWAQSEPLRTGEMVWVSSGGDDFPRNRYFAGEVQDLPRSDSPVRVSLASAGDSHAVATVTADTFAYQVRLLGPWSGMRASDGYFDLVAGESVDVTLTGLPVGFDPALISARAYAGPLPRLAADNQLRSTGHA